MTLTQEAAAALERALTEETDAPLDTRPEAKAALDAVKATMQLAQTVGDLLTQIDLLTEENNNLHTALADAQSTCASLSNELKVAAEQRDFFKSGFDTGKADIEAAHRVLEHALRTMSDNYSERLKHARTMAQEEGRSIPSFLTGNVRPIKQGKPVRMGPTSIGA